MKDIARNIEATLEFSLKGKSWKDFTVLEKELIELCLEIRKEILNKDFSWTEEAKAGILKLNAALFEANALINEEYDKLKSELEAREKSEDKFLTGYKIDKKITMMIKTILNKNWGECWEEWYGIYDFYMILNNYIGHNNVYASKIASINDDDFAGSPLNWNNMIGTASEQFKDDFIHYGIRCLWYHTPLAWEDILKICSLRTEIAVDYQRITDLF
jgi:hypothetical protein